MSQASFQGPIGGENVNVGNQYHGSTIHNYFAAPSQSTQGHETDSVQMAREACLKSLRYPSINDRHNDITDAHPRTCDWLFGTAEFQMWRDRVDLPAHNGVLWIKGKPGAGKSTLMKHALRHYKDCFPQYLVVAHFFNSRGDILEKTPQGLWQSLLYQLLNQDSALSEAFMPVFQDILRIPKETDHEWQHLQLRGLVASMVKKCTTKPVLLLVDALDECHEQGVREVVDFLENLSINAVYAGNILRICLSSRHYPSISMKKTLEVTVENNHDHQRDIGIYIHDKLRIIDEDIEGEILRKADGIFMWAVLVVPLLNTANDEGDEEAMERTLKEIPDSLDAVFANMLKKEGQKKEEMVHMLQWVLLSERPLTPGELFTLVTRKAAPSKKIIKQRITNSSNGLIEIRKGEKGEEIVQFIHLSVNDFLFRNDRLQTLDKTLGVDPVSATHCRLWGDCWFYLQLLNSEPTSQHHIANFQNKYPCLVYVLDSIFYHADMALSRRKRKSWFEVWASKLIPPSLSSHQDAIEEWLGKHEEWFKWWSQYIHAMDREEVSHYWRDSVDLPLYAFSLRDYEYLVSALLEGNGVDVNAEGGNYGNALQAACFGGSKSIVQILLEKGANVNAQGGIYGNALYAAYCRGKKSIVQILVKKGANMSHFDHY